MLLSQEQKAYLNTKKSYENGKAQLKHLQLAEKTLINWSIKVMKRKNVFNRLELSFVNKYVNYENMNEKTKRSFIAIAMEVRNDYGVMPIVV